MPRIPAPTAERCAEEIEQWIVARKEKGKAGTFSIFVSSDTGERPKIRPVQGWLYANGTISVDKREKGCWKVNHVPTGRSLCLTFFSSKTKATRYACALTAVCAWEDVGEHGPEDKQVGVVCKLLYYYCQEKSLTGEQLRTIVAYLRRRTKEMNDA